MRVPGCFDCVHFVPVFSKYSNKMDEMDTKPKIGCEGGKKVSYNYKTTSKTTLKNPLGGVFVAGGAQPPITHVR